MAGDRRNDLKPYYGIVEDELGATPYPYADTTPKTQLMLRAAARLGKRMLHCRTWRSHSLAGRGAGHAPSTEGAAPNYLYDASLYSCRLCGECDVGCNYGSKNTLDLTYLSRAAGADAFVHPRCEVRRFRPCEGGFQVCYVEHLPENEGAPLDTSRLPLHEIRCRRLILAAGALGSTYLLLRNQDAFPGLGPALGTHFSGNGDVLAWIHGSPDRLEPSYGPVITSTWYEQDYADGGDGPGYYLQDGGHPVFIDWVFQLTRPPLGSLLRLVAGRVARQVLRAAPQSEVGGGVASLFGRRATGRGNPAAAGLRARRARRADAAAAGLARRRSVRSVFQSTVRADRAGHGGAGAGSGRQGTCQSRDIAASADDGPSVGWSADGSTSAAAGVVDQWGQAFGYPGLFVVDGSAMPGPVGTNPSHDDRGVGGAVRRTACWRPWGELDHDRSAESGRPDGALVLARRRAQGRLPGGRAAGVARRGELGRRAPSVPCRRRGERRGLQSGVAGARA